MRECRSVCVRVYGTFNLQHIKERESTIRLGCDDDDDDDDGDDDFNNK